MFFGPELFAIVISRLERENLKPKERWEDEKLLTALLDAFGHRLNDMDRQTVTRLTSQFKGEPPPEYTEAEAAV